MGTTLRDLASSTQLTHVASGGSVAAGGMSVAGDVATALASSNNFNYPAVDLALFASFSAALSSLSNFINVYRRDLDIDGTNDAPAPSTAAPTFSSALVGVFSIPVFTAASSGYFSCLNVPISENCQLFIENKCNITISAGWTLKCKPKTDRYVG
ncbi:MAG: hypothetical protein E6Q97_17370 [Desulfurellales bacterium]|nr:MAG: hypothetical protein E6Q97_17370 [Desulfurellales bacterium]